MTTQLDPKKEEDDNGAVQGASQYDLTLRLTPLNHSLLRELHAFPAIDTW